MSISPDHLGVVVAHGRVAEALVAAAAEISGISDGLIPVSNTDCDRATLEERVTEALQGRPAVIFVDMPSGSCFLATLHQIHGVERATVVTGVNLAMLLDFLFHRQLGQPELVKRAVRVGTEAIRACPSS